MASVSGFVVIGTPHQNENGISPDWIAELWEGDRAKWILRPLKGRGRARGFSPESPAKIGQSLLEILELLAPGSTNSKGDPIDMSLIVVAMEQSSLLKTIPRLRKLRRIDVHIASVSDSRVYSTWSGDWVESA